MLYYSPSGIEVKVRRSFVGVASAAGLLSRCSVGAQMLAFRILRRTVAGLALDICKLRGFLRVGEAAACGYSRCMAAYTLGIEILMSLLQCSHCLRVLCLGPFLIDVRVAVFALFGC